MNETSGISTQSIIDQVNQRSQTDKSDSGESDFLKLLVAQLNNQNPLSPQDNGEFLSQLAQFSTVEGVEKLNLTMEKFSSSMLSSQALQATALVGRSVLIPSDTGRLNSGSALTGMVELPASTGNLALKIYNESGELVRQLPLGAHGAGTVKFSWDGIGSNGQAMPSGYYRITADANLGEQSEQLATRVNANVDSVTMGQSGGVILNLEGALGSVALNDILQIN
ncbi:MAG: flagellar hook assembly protein FlgD [Pseudomonadales bacterium]|nr:flagellar hook assembly protein FlgD [Pseudomonadales bacterium]MCP5214317.1 flagellar hook assembly protein FlgD [Pseudomonadales bacterium]